MTNKRNHPKRGKASNGKPKNPTPDEVVAARLASNLTQEEAASMVHSNLRSWQQWEAPVGSSSHRRMHAAFFELFNIKRQFQPQGDPK